MQRSIVLLPEPLRPMIATISPGSTASETPFSTSTGPKLLWTSRSSTSGTEPHFQAPAGARQGEADREIERGHDEIDREWAEGGVRDHLAGAGQLDEADRRGERGVLDELDREADRRRDAEACRLRNDNVAELLREVEPQRGGGFPLRAR